MGRVMATGSQLLYVAVSTVTMTCTAVWIVLWNCTCTQLYMHLLYIRLISETNTSKKRQNHTYMELQPQKSQHKVTKCKKTFFPVWIKEVAFLNTKTQQLQQYTSNSRPARHIFVTTIFHQYSQTLFATQLNKDCLYPAYTIWQLFCAPSCPNHLRNTQHYTNAVLTLSVTYLNVLCHCKQTVLQLFQKLITFPYLSPDDTTICFGTELCHNKQHFYTI
jgi:hypothetical protein